MASGPETDIKVFATGLAAGGIYHYIGNNNQEWNAIMATAVVASVPATVLLIIAQRYVAAGIGSRIVSTAPLRSNRLAAAIVPCMASINPREIASPRPVPARTWSPFCTR